MIQNVFITIYTLGFMLLLYDFWLGVKLRKVRYEHTSLMFNQYSKMQDKLKRPYIDFDEVFNYTGSKTNALRIFRKDKYTFWSSSSWSDKLITFLITCAVFLAQPIIFAIGLYLLLLIGLYRIKQDHPASQRIIREIKENFTELWTDKIRRILKNKTQSSDLRVIIEHEQTKVDTRIKAVRLDVTTSNEFNTATRNTI